MQSELCFCPTIWIWKKNFEISFSCEVIRDWPLSKNKWLIIFTEVKVTIKIIVGITNLKHLDNLLFYNHLKIAYYLKVLKIWPWPLRLTFRKTCRLNHILSYYMNLKEEYRNSCWLWRYKRLTFIKKQITHYFHEGQGHDQDFCGDYKFKPFG